MQTRAVSPNMNKNTQAEKVDQSRFVGNNRCPHCGLFFISQSQVDRHVAKRHGPVKPQLIDEIDAIIAKTADPIATDRLYATRDKLVAQTAAQGQNVRT